MANVDTLILNAQIRANSFANATGELVTDLLQLVTDQPEIDNPYTLDVTQVNLPEYVAPPKDASPMPVYEPPTAQLPTAPALSEIGGIVLPPTRTAPTLDINDLFNTPAPSTEPLVFEAETPDLAIQELLDELEEIAAAAVPSAVEMPDDRGFNLDFAAVSILPDYRGTMVFDALESPVEGLRDIIVNHNEKELPLMQAYIQSKTSEFIGQYAPEFGLWMADLSTRVSEGMNGVVLPDGFEQSQYIKAQGRVEREFSAIEEGLLDSYSKSGLMAPPGALLSGVQRGRLKGAEALANQATDIYIERQKLEVSHRQFAMGMASTHVQGIRTLVLSYIDTQLKIMGHVLDHGKVLADYVGKAFEYLLAREQTKASTLNAMMNEAEYLLKASVRDVEYYTVQVAQQNAQTNHDRLAIEQAETALKINEDKLNQRRDLRDTIKQRAEIQEMKLKQLSFQADIFKTKSQAQIASFDVYSAAVKGDAEKMQGELSKLAIFDSQIKADSSLLENQVQVLKATESVNAAKLQAYQLGGDVYKLDAAAAVQKFTAYAEVKKLAQSIYGQELVNAVEAYKVGMEPKTILLNGLIKQYEVQVSALLKSAEIEVNRLKIAADANATAVDAFKGMASSALGGLNTVVSQSINE
jgi:uncharacterized membrane protein YciS (DUF1049 family)